MKKEILKQKLKNQNYSESSVKFILMGKRKPSYEKMINLNNDGIPFTAWEDIKSFISDNNSSKSRSNKSMIKA